MQTSCKGAAKEILRQIKNIFSLCPLQSSSQNNCTPLQEYKKQKSVEKAGQKRNLRIYGIKCFLLSVESTKLPSGQTECRKRENTAEIHIEMKIDCEFLSHISNRQLFSPCCVWAAKTKANVFSFPLVNNIMMYSVNLVTVKIQ